MKNDSRNEATNIINKSSDASLRTSPSKYYDEETEVILLLLVVTLQVSPQRQCLTSFLFGSLNSLSSICTSGITHEMEASMLVSCFVSSKNCFNSNRSFSISPFSQFLADTSDVNES